MSRWEYLYLGWDYHLMQARVRSLTGLGVVVLEVEMLEGLEQVLVLDLGWWGCFLERRDWALAWLELEALKVS